MTARKENSKYYVKIIIWLAVIIILWQIPAGGALTPAGVHTLAVFVGLIWGLITIGNEIPGLVCTVLMAFTGAFSSIAESLMAGFGSQTVVMVFSLLLISGVMSASGLAQTIARRMINAKFAAGKPWRLTLVIMITSAVISAFIHPLVIILVIANICLNIFKELDLEKGNRWAMLTLMDITVVAINANDILPFQPANGFTFGFFTSFDSRLSVSAVAGPHIIASILLEVLLIAFCFVLTRVSCKKCVEKLYAYKPKEVNEPFTPKMKATLTIFIVYIFANLLPLALPDGSFKDFMNTFGIPGWAIAAVIVCIFIRRKDGTHLMTFDEIQQSGVKWGLLLMLLGICACVAPMTSDVTGISTWLGDLIRPVALNLGEFGCFVMLTMFCLLLTNFADNIAVNFIIVPIAFIVCKETGLNPYLTISWVIHGFQFGILTPAATPHIAFIFGMTDTGYVSKGRLMLWAIPKIIFVGIVIVFIGWLTKGLYPAFVW